MKKLFATAAIIAALSAPAVALEKGTPEDSAEWAGKIIAVDIVCGFTTPKYITNAFILHSISEMPEQRAKAIAKRAGGEMYAKLMSESPEYRYGFCTVFKSQVQGKDL